jgi:hypothetical protein
MLCLPEFNKLMEGENAADKELLDKVCSAFDLQPRGSSGEHSAAVVSQRERDEEKERSAQGVGVCDIV